MERSFTDSDVSLSPSQLIERIQLIRQLQLLQKGKLQKQQLQFNDSPQTSSSITEIVSHFSSSTSYNTFLSLLQGSQNDGSQNVNTSKVKESDLIDGVSILDVSQSSAKSPEVNISRHSISSKGSNESKKFKNTSEESKDKRVIQLDEMPILSPKKDFESLVLEKLIVDKAQKQAEPRDSILSNQKKPFLRRGEGMSRFGLKKDDLVVQSTKSLPWKQRSVPSKGAVKKKPSKFKETVETPIMAVENPKRLADKVEVKIKEVASKVIEKPKETQPKVNHKDIEITVTPPLGEEIKQNVFKKPNVPVKHPVLANKGKTWASILRKEQDDFLRQLKQSDYYKNFVSPAKSIASECDDQLNQISQEREIAEQNMFELLESKVSHDSFSLENSFFNKFLKRAQLESSGESTPIIMQKCLARKPELLKINPGLKCNDTQSDAGTCSCDYTDCDQETCSSVSTCCTCKTVEESCQVNKNSYKDQKKKEGKTKEVNTKRIDNKTDVPEKDRNDSANDSETMKTNMAEMNAKLVATSELLKDRLRELEDEIETFRKENANLNKLREEVDLERQKFYEEKAAFEQKFNEEKILSEYYLAEEKEKLLKQKQTYERYVREMRGRLNKKEKVEVLNLKGEISNLKDEIRIKDAKSTSTIARLRNQLKIMEKEKKDLNEEVEKLKKVNRRMQHSNEMTRRITNIKYLEEINKKLNNMTKETDSVQPDKDAKYKAFEIERQSRKRNVAAPIGIRPRAKSVPNLKVTSRYAKYFSQRDSVSQMDDNVSDDDIKADESIHSNNNAYGESDEENNLERIYNERFKSSSQRSSKESDTNSNTKDFFLTRDNSPARSESIESLPDDIAKTSLSTSHKSYSSSRSKSPVSILSNKNLRSNLSCPNIESKTSLTKTTLNPTEIIKPDGSKELRFPNGNTKFVSADGKYSKFVYYNGDVKENFLPEGRIKYYYAETKTFHTTHPDGLEVLEFADGHTEKRYPDGSSEIRLPNGSVRYHNPRDRRLREEWRFPDGSVVAVAADGERRVTFANGQVEVHAKDHKRREYPDGTVKLVYRDGSAETRYASGRVRIRDRNGTLLMDTAQAQAHA